MIKGITVNHLTPSVDAAGASESGAASKLFGAANSDADELETRPIS